MKKCLLFMLLVIVLSFKISPTCHSQVLEGRIEDAKGIIGVDLSITSGSVPVVRQIFSLTPAYYADIHPGDKITKIDNQPTQGLNKEEIDIAISDIPGVIVNFELIRDSKVLHKNVKVVSVQEIDQKLQQLYLNEDY